MKLNFAKTLFKVFPVIVCGAGMLTQGPASAQRLPVSRPARPQRVNGKLNAGPGAFVSRPVNTTDELLAALQKDKVARQRYAKHFGVSEDKVVDFVKNALVITPLDRTRTVTDYYVAKNGVIKSRREVMPKGTKVWSTRSGLPIFKWICANPLTDRLPGPVVVVTEPIRSVKLGESLTPGPDAQTDGLRSQVAVPDIAATTPLAEPDGSGSALALKPIALSNIGGSGVGSVGGFPTSAIAGGLIAAPFVIPLVTGGGGGGNSGGGFNGGVAPVPEPTSLALIGVGLPLALGMSRRRTRAAR